jgi:hypothetical protein
MKEQYMTTQSRKANGYGHTYKIKGTNSWRTVYSVNGRVVTGTAKDKATSRARAKEKLNLLPVGQANQGLTATTMTLGEFLARWLTQEHKTAIAQRTDGGTFIPPSATGASRRHHSPSTYAL